jgi:hypothetical protein
MFLIKLLNLSFAFLLSQKRFDGVDMGSHFRLFYYVPYLASETARVPRTEIVIQQQ